MPNNPILNGYDDYDINPHQRLRAPKIEIRHGQPLRDMWTDFKYTFWAYETNFIKEARRFADISANPHLTPQHDFLQIFRGLRNCLRAVEFLSLAILKLFAVITCVVPILDAWRKRNDAPPWETFLSWPIECADNFWFGLQYTIRGLTEVATYLTGLTFLKIATRSVLKWWADESRSHFTTTYSQIKQDFLALFKVKPYQSLENAKPDALIIFKGLKNLSKMLLGFTVFLVSAALSLTLIIPLGMFIYSLKKNSLKKSLKKGLTFPKTTVQALKLSLAYGLLSLIQTASYLTGLIFVKILLRGTIGWWRHQPYIAKIFDKKSDVTVRDVLQNVVKDFRDTVKPYKSSHYIKRDALQFVAGIRNIIASVLSLGMGALYTAVASTIIIPIILALYNIYDGDSPRVALRKAFFVDEIAFTLGYGLVALLRGTTQLLTYPLMLPRMILRIFNTWRNGGYQVLQENTDIKKLADDLLEKLLNNQDLSNHLRNNTNIKIKFEDGKVHSWNKPDVKPKQFDLFYQSTYAFLADLAILESKRERYQKRGQPENSGDNISNEAKKPIVKFESKSGHIFASLKQREASRMTYDSDALTHLKVVESKDKNPLPDSQIDIVDDITQHLKYLTHRP